MQVPAIEPAMHVKSNTSAAGEAAKSVTLFVHTLLAFIASCSLRLFNLELDTSGVILKELALRCCQVMCEKIQRTSDKGG